MHFFQTWLQYDIIICLSLVSLSIYEVSEKNMIYTGICNDLSQDKFFPCFDEKWGNASESVGDT